jgi:hypothetical protein
MFLEDVHLNRFSLIHDAAVSQSCSQKWSWGNFSEIVGVYWKFCTFKFQEFYEDKSSSDMKIEIEGELPGGMMLRSSFGGCGEIEGGFRG